MQDEHKPESDLQAEPEAPVETGPEGDAPPEAGEQTGDAEATNADRADAAGDTDDPAALRDLLREAEARADENWDKFLRAGAEQENIRKRAEREVDQARRFALERFATDLLAVIDSLELGLKSASEADADQDFLDGMELTLRMLRETCAKHGVTTIDPVGQAFDPNLHEAMTMVPTEAQAPNTVIDVLQKGYSLNDRLLRAAMVTVAKAP